VKKLLLALSFAVCVASAALAQVESDERALLDVEDGITFSKDSLFLMHLRFRMQNRVALRTLSAGDWSLDDIEARVRRLRLRFDGFTGIRQLQYYIQLSFSRADTDQEGEGEAKIIRDAILYYEFNRNFYIGFGQSKLPGNRQRVTSSGNLQFGDRSIANARFTIDRDFGLFAYHTLQARDMFFISKWALSTGEGRNISFTSPGIAYTGRLEWLPFGAFSNGGDFSEGDLEFENQPKFSLAATYSFNQGTTKTGGQLGIDLAEGIDLTSIIFDASLKYRGHALLLEHFTRRSSILEAMAFAGAPVLIPSGIGANLQYSYLLPSFWEFAVRYSQVSLETRAADGRLDREMLLGISRYVNKHRVKAQMNFGYYSRREAGMLRDNLLALFQVEFGI
jgi:phosphate-selective porin OprO/OprP